ncbi:MAG: hypothetical protein MR889_05985 [Clostridiales bacterium]|nr:hypothetical protein [Clostridiales bacterium]MDY4435993.1 hypothetical protein [Candidatus Flemingibacterium sp.]
MNYILQLNGFRLRRRLCPIPMSAIALYYVILENFNQVGFPDSLEIPIGILAGELSTCDNTVRRARQELFDNGYIFYESGRQKHSAIYQLIDLDPRYFSVKMEDQVI